MSTDVQIRGESKRAAVLDTRAGPAINGLVTLTTPLVPVRVFPASMVNDTYGRAMNQAIAFSGTPVRIHDGEDSSLWTATNIVGTKMDPNSTAQAQAGSQSIEVDNPSLNDVWEINSGGTQALGSYTAFSMYVYVDKSWTTDSVEMYGWDGGAEVGIRVKLEDYFDQSTFDTWHFMSIPLTDMELEASTIESLRMTLQTKTGGQAPKFYIDELILQETGDTAEFTPPSPNPSEDFFISKIALSMADNVTSVVTNGTMPGLDYTKFLGVGPLAQGVLFEHVDDNETVISEVYDGIGDMLAAGWEIESAVSNGTNTFVTVARVFVPPLVLKGYERGNHVSFIVRDDLSGLLSLTAQVQGATPK